MANIRKLEPNLAEKAQREINEVRERIEIDLDHLKEWIRKQPHLRVRMDDQWLILFLRGCKYSLEQAKKKLDLYYSSKDLIPELFRNRDPAAGLLHNAIHMCTIFPLDSKDDPTRPLIVYYHFNIDPATVNSRIITEVVKYLFICTEIFLMEYDSYSVSGLEAIIDFDQLTLSHLLHVTPSFIKKCVISIEKVYPLRVKKVHFIKSPPAWENILKIVKAVCSPKFASRLHVHHSLEDFYKCVPQRVLPSDLGGEGLTREEMEMKMEKKIMAYRDWLLEDEKYGTDEKLRLGKAQTTESFLGIEGSFRKLSVD